MDKMRAAVPWHLWVVGVLGLLWNGYGGYDYFMTMTDGDAYMAGMGMTADQIAYMDAMPAWMSAVWAVGVWGAVLGSVLLLLRMKWAVYAFAASLAALLISLVYAFFLSNGGEIMGQLGMIMNAVVTVAAVFFLWYARTMTSRGVLR